MLPPQRADEVLDERVRQLHIERRLDLVDTKDAEVARQRWKVDSGSWSVLTQGRGC